MLSSFQFHHIGIATDSILKTSSYYLKMGYVMSEVMYDPVQDVNISFLKKDGMPEIELLEPNSSASPVSRTLEKLGVTPYHVCYSVPDIDVALLELRREKFLPLFKPVGAVALSNKKICFLFNKNFGLIELVEE